jgi:hypothetical protein
MPAGPHTDDGWCEPHPDGRQMWPEDAIQAILDTEDAEVLFVAGCAENQARRPNCHPTRCASVQAVSGPPI